MPKIIKVCAKCSDLFTAQLVEDGTYKGEYIGYVPGWFPSPNVQHYGDYVELDIDADTGQVLNWKKPTQKDLKIFVDKPE